MNTRHTPVRPRRARKIILSALAIILLLIIAAPFAALPIANNLAKGYITKALTSSPSSSASIDTIALSWSGPQQIAGLRFDDNAGSSGHFNATISKGLLDFYNNRSDLGEIRLTGAAEIAAPPQTTPGNHTTETHEPKDAKKPAAQPFQLPSGLALDLVLEHFELTLTAPNPEDPDQPIRSKWTDINGAVQLTSGTDLRAWLEATGPQPNEIIDLDIRSNNLFSPAGVLQHHAAETDVIFEIELADQTFEAIRPLFNIPPEIVAGEKHFRAQAKLKDANTLLTTADPSHPPFVSFSIAPELIRSISPTAPFAAHPVTFALNKLALPITADPANPVDLAALSIECSVHTYPITLPLQLEPNTPPTNVRIDQIAVDINSESLSEGITLHAQGSTAADSLEPGKLDARISVSNLFDVAGTLDPANAQYFAAGSLTAIPTPLVAPLAQRFGLDLTAGLGPTVNITARIEPEIFDAPTTHTDPQPLLATINFNCEHALGVIGLRYIPGVSLSQWEKPLNFSCFNAASLASQLIDDAALDISGDGSVIAQISDFYIPLAPDNTPALDDATARFRFIVGDASIRTNPNLPPIYVESIDLELNIESDKPPRLAMESRILHNNSPATASARFDLVGFDPTNPTDFSNIHPVGTLTAPDVPAELLELISPDLAEQAASILGPTFTATITAPPESTAQTAALAQLALTATNLSANAIISYENSAAALSDLTAQLILSPETARSLLAKAGSAAPLELIETATINLAINDISIAPGGTPFAPDQFRLDANATIPSIALAVPSDITVPGDTSAPGRLDLIDAAMHIKSTPDHALKLTINANHKDETRKPFAAQATLSNFASPEGEPTPAAATINATAKGDLPTPFIDALARSPGTFTALLGPAATINADATNLSTTTGSLHATLNSQSTEAKLSGSIENGAFVADSITTMSINAISKDASKLLFENALPFLSSVEKTLDDDPATLTIESFAFPIDTDMKKLVGKFLFDPGTVQFQTSSVFSKVLSATHNKAVGTVGRKIEPINFTIESGVVRYEEFTLPAGEFNLVTVGKVNLVTD
jgi:hypothetical protein